MKFRFKVQAFQTDAVEAVVDCFEGQPLETGLRYRIDPGMVATRPDRRRLEMDEGFRNSDSLLPAAGHPEEHSGRAGAPEPARLRFAEADQGESDVNLDVEMETGTGKTYCYIKTIFELNKRYGWSKFIVVVPQHRHPRRRVRSRWPTRRNTFWSSTARGSARSSTIPRRCTIWRASAPTAGINVMIINVQAFNARGKDARRIYEELDDFQSRRPIDVIAANRPILILDEPQKMEGARTVESMKEFNPLFILRYSATHKQEHNKIYRLDALDAYNQKLVKKIAVRGISVKGQAGTNAYLYLQSIEVSTDKPP